MISLHRVSLPICLALAAWGIIAPESLAESGQAFTDRVFSSLDWFFMLTVTGLLVLSLWLVFSRYGRLRLGGEDTRPDFSVGSWLAMLFSAGIGSGLLFWGVAEPITHFAHPPVGDASTADSAASAMLITNFHWGFHAWAIYGVAGLVLAYFGFRRGTAYLAGAPIRSAFDGRWVAPTALLADLVAVLAVALGVAGALVMGTQQLSAGLGIVTVIPGEALTTQLALLAVVTVAFLISATTSLDKGIKVLSNINIVLALLLMTFVLLAGPTSFLLRNFTDSLGDYLSALPSLTLNLYAFEEIGGWVHSWTLTYFVWWIAWAPFVGIFIARISRGRTIREFVLGVVIAPSLLSVLWFSIFGGVGLHEELLGAGQVAAIVDADVTRALFNVFDRLPLSTMLSSLSIVLIFIFLITSADSATFVLGMLTSQGSFDPPGSRKLAWGLALSGVSAGIMLTGSVAAARTLSILGAIPFTFVLLLQVGALLRALPRDAAAAAEKAAK